MTFFSSWSHYFYFTKINKYLPNATFYISTKGKLSLLTDILALVGFTMILYLVNQWYKKERYVQEMSQKKTEMELDLLKSQINPHFLFNSLNSIYIMLDKNLADGKKMLLQFSEILSHQLYETNKHNIMLMKEIENLNNYIEIEKIRHQDLVNVNVEISENIKGLMISPMLLLPIIENAFKHGQNSNGYWISVKLTTLPASRLCFIVENSHNGEIVKPRTRKNGIGLINVKRRLELVYPNRHQLNIEKNNSTFKVDLEIELNE